ncbi:MAG: imidazolonepropionase [Calditrichaeota bacterium]|nr:imidazolonepropionase [Calditrichota bacterium]
MKTLYFDIKQLINPIKKHGMSGLEIMDDAAFLVEDGVIHEAGKKSELLAKNPDVKKISLHNQTVLPGFIDSHTHPVFWKTREAEFEMRLQGKSYEEIAAAGGGIRNSVRALREASEDELFDISLERTAKFLEYGTTTIEAKSGYGLSFDDEVKSLRVIQRLNKESALELHPTFLGAHEVPDEYRSDKNKYIDIIINEMIPYVAEEKLAVYCDIFCEKGVFEIDESERILEAAKKHGLIPRLHADELFPLGGAELAAKVGAVSADHLLQVSDDGIQALKTKNVIATLLPGTAFFIRKMNYAPARKLIDAGCKVALATDFNPGSSFTQNLQFIMSLSCLNMGMLPDEVINAVTKHAAAAVNSSDRIGRIDTGYQADFVTMDIPNYQYLVYNYAINHATSVYKKGELVFQGHEKERSEG